jgi:hypothetical protein
MKEEASSMKLSGFLMGSLLGAAATVYISRKRPGAVAWAAGALSEVCHTATSKTIAKIMSKDLGREAAATLSPKHSDDTAEKSAAAWGQIEAIVASDPELKRETDKIKAESSSVSH